MALVPKKLIDRVQFYENHLAIWNTNAPAIGTTTAIIADLTTKTEAARAAWVTHQLAQSAARTATEAFYNAVDVMSSAGAAVIKQIRAQADSTGNPGVYTLADIPAPATPSPVGPPGTPYEPEVELQADGSLILKWKCNNPTGAQGTMYHLYRRDTPEGQFVHIGGSGQRKFLDATIPAGSSQVTYQIQAVRSTSIGAWAQFNVNFGVSGQTTVTQVKLAA